MNLTWHIVCKDLRRLWPWLVLITSVIATRYGFIWQFEHSLHIDRPLFDRAAGIESLLLGIQLLLCGIFVVAVLHDDSPLDPRAFWLTRPIAGLRLLAAKLITIIIGSILLPLTGLLLWWWLHDFRACDIAASIPTLMVRYVILASVVFVFALFNRTWLGFTSTLVISLLVLGLLNVTAKKIDPEISAALSLTRFTLIFFCAVASLCACAYLLYQRRRIGPAYTTLAASVVVCILIGLCWPWDLQSRFRFSGNPPSPVAPEAAGIRVTPQPLHSPTWVTTTHTALHAQLPLTLTDIPADHIVVPRRAWAHHDQEKISQSVASITKASRDFYPRLPRLPPATTETQSVLLDLKRSWHNDPQLRTASATPFDTPIQTSFLLRRITPIASLANAPGQNGHTGPYHLRILEPSPPYSSIKNWDNTRAITCLIVHPAQLTAPGTGFAESCGAPNDTDETGRHVEERATVFAILPDREIPPIRTHSGMITFTVDGVFFVRRSFELDLPPADFKSLKLHYISYPALGIFERTLPPPSTADVQPAPAITDAPPAPHS